MKFLFDDTSFSFETLRATSYAYAAGAEVGEVIVTADHIPDGDERAWSTEWAALATRVEQTGRTALAAGHRVSAREALLRASNYYRVADFYLREDPAGDHEHSLGLARSSQRTFADAVPLLDTPARYVDVPYEGTTLPGLFFTPDDSGRRRPTLLFHGGIDSTLEELYFAGAAGALRRGYNVLAWDGPGQGSNVREKELYFRPDWEATVTPAVDLALTLPEVDGDRLALMGMSLGGYLAPRAAAFEPRLAACVAYDGVWDLHASLTNLFAQAADLPGGLDQLLAESTISRWAARCGVWSFGVSNVDELVEASKVWTLDGVAEQITCPTLVLDAEEDQFFKGQAKQLFDALTCEKEFIFFSSAEGAGQHCSEGTLLLLAQRTFDWLDQVLGHDA
ncbi:alpha/beta hydrolase family protein [Actinomycetospora chiangmaiensis]|uniref:alpha/beta hydrolase family protein n=1 Tax=Actinomycetospora chiangmaiensis TaxID=402650 RepID=UPI00036EDF95|nr:alpha/beta fold hydrolase [Actinomycetospora chiangmaiensis]